MKNTRAWLAAVLLAPAAGALSAESPPQLREDAPDSYEVVRGDTLWDIAGEFLEDPWLWPEVWEVNPQIDNPHLIYPGDIVALRYVNGQPVLSLQRRGQPDLPEVKLEPRIRREPFTSAIPAIDLDQINSFIDNKRIISRPELEGAAYFVATERGALMASTGDRIYARGSWQDQLSSYEILRPGRVFTDLSTGAEIGIEGIYVGEAIVMSREEDKAILRVEEVAREVRRGDIFLPRRQSELQATFFPRAPDFLLEGRIVEIGNGLAYGGVDDSLIVNVGSETGLEAGHLLSLRQPPRRVRDPVTGEVLSYPGEEFGTVLIYRVFDSASLGLVLESDQQIRMEDWVVTP